MIVAKSKIDIENKKKMNKIVDALKTCDKRFMIHEFINQSSEEVGGYMELIFEPRTEMCGAKIIGVKVKYTS